MGARERSRRVGVAILVAASSAGAWLVLPAASVADAIAPAQPPGCPFTLGPLTTSGALGSLGLFVAAVPQVPTQECTTTVTVTTTIASMSGLPAAGVDNNPLSSTTTLNFAPDRLPQSLGVLWEGYCTTTGAPSELIIQAGVVRFVVSLGSQDTCASKGVFPSSLQVIQAQTPDVVGIAPAPGDTGYRLLNDGTTATTTKNLDVLGTPGLTMPDSVGLPQVAITPTPNGNGDWSVSAAGTVTAYSAPLHGDLAGVQLNAPIVGMAADSATGGYWLVAADGGVFSFDAPFRGSMGGSHLNSPIVGMASTVDGGGYWLVAADGGVFAFGDAHFWGSAGSLHLNSPVTGISADSATGGYWLVAADGGVFSYHAPFFGSAGGMHLNAGVSGMAATTNGGGYWLVAADGGVFTYGNAHFYGSGALITG